jgi:hypothetical protein
VRIDDELMNPLSTLFRLFNNYSRVDEFVFDLIKAQFCTQLINASFFISLNYYLLDYGFKDYEIANFIAWRYLAVALLGIPFGFYIKGRDLRKIMLTGSVIFPFIALAIIFAIPSRNIILIKGLMAAYSAIFLLIHITPLPFIMKYSKKETLSEALSLQFQIWGLAVMLVGFLTYFLQKISLSIFTNQHLLLLYALIGFIGIFYIYRIKVIHIPEENVISKFTDHFKGYDWGLIWKSSLSVQFIAVGAGFTIPFFSLYFQKVFQWEAAKFSILTSFAHLLVAFGMFITPWIRHRFGYKVGIIFLQSIGVVCLIVFASTEWYSQWWFAVYIAMFFYCVRQPLMNSAGPLTSELTMDYVGQRNREMLSSIEACIWNSGWLFSAKIFEFLRYRNVPYSSIFLITAVMYIGGILANWWIIKDMEKRTLN